MNAALPATVVAVVLYLIQSCPRTAAGDATQCSPAKRCSCSFGLDDVSINNSNGGDVDARTTGLAVATGVLSGVLLGGGAAAAYLHFRGKGGGTPLGEESGRYFRPSSSASSTSSGQWNGDRRPDTSSSSTSSKYTNVYRHNKVWPGRR